MKYKYYTCLPAIRPMISTIPFSTALVLDRSDKRWHGQLENPYYLYPVHVSQSFLFTPSLSSGLYLLLMRWLCFRISIGAGLIKIRGGSCWEAHTCLHYHFETQPIPSPTSFVFHFLPKPLLSRAVDLDLFVQLYSSWLVLVPGGHVSLRALRRLGGFLQAGFMGNIMLSGNYGFLNHLTVVPALACLDACEASTLDLGERVAALLHVSAREARLFRLCNSLDQPCNLRFLGIVACLLRLCSSCD